MSLQYLKKEVKAEVDFLHGEFPSLFQHFEHQLSYKVDIIINGHGQVFSNHSK